MALDPNTVFIIPASALGSLLIIATVSDMLTHRIPNTLCILLLISGLAFQTAVGGMQGLATGLGGVITGVLILLPFYLMGGMAAGDVKLLASGSSYLGPLAALAAGTVTLVAGALLAILYVVFRLMTKALAANNLPINMHPGSTRSETQTIGRERFPFALAIAIGVAAGALSGESLIAQLLPAGGIR